MRGPVLSALHPLATAGRRLIAVWARGGPDPEPDRAGFRRRLEAALARVPAGLSAETAWVELRADRPPWTHTGLRLSRGDSVTLLSCGRNWMSRRLDLWTGADFQVWARVGGAGPILRGTRDTHTFSAAADGELELASHPPGEWADRDGRLAGSDDAYAAGDGGFTVLAIRWAREPKKGLAALADADEPNGPFARERARLAEPDPTPAGWRHLWFLGPSEIYARRREDGRDALSCRTHRDVGILQRDVSLPLSEATRLRWSWKVDTLPSSLPEDTPLTHDYLSIAVEFENGRDLTYTWSASLPVEHGYACPLPNWTSRETHVVVRSGSGDLGRWLDEERSLRADYARYIGEPPERIVRVWLIAVSLFQRRLGKCHYADIALVDETGTHPVR